MLVESVSEGGDAVAGEFAAAYRALGPEDRLACLRTMVEELGPSKETVTAAARLLLGPPPAALHDARAALEPSWTTLLRRLNALGDGPSFLAELRRDLRRALPTALELAPLEHDLTTLLAVWFDACFLELRQVSWDSPASLLETLAEREAVHAVEDWDDLKKRLDADRRVYALFHLRIPNEPIAFVEIALTRGLVAEVGALLDPKTPAIDPTGADTAIFYSISNPHGGLAWTDSMFSRHLVGSD